MTNQDEPRQTTCFPSETDTTDTTGHNGQNGHVRNRVFSRCSSWYVVVRRGMFVFGRGLLRQQWLRSQRLKFHAFLCARGRIFIHAPKGLQCPGEAPIIKGQAQGAPAERRDRIMTARKSTTKAPAVESKAPEAPEQSAPEGALSVADIAEQAGVTSKDMRRWLRAQARNAGAGDALPGKGGRYAFTAEQASAIVGAYGRSKAQKGTQAPAVAILAALAPSAPAE